MTTATVETLTAEVRVLMIGNRQITLGVAKQLDTVMYADLEPFGRYRNTDGSERAIGRNSSGQLVTSRLPRDDPEFSFVDLTHDNFPVGSFVLCACQRHKSNPVISLDSDWVVFTLRERTLIKDWRPNHEVHSGRIPRQCYWWRGDQPTIAALHEIEQREDAQRSERIRVHAESRALSLIVLAGLR